MGPNLDERLNFNVGLVISPKIHGRYKHLRRKNRHVNTNCCYLQVRKVVVCCTREKLLGKVTREQ